MRNSNCRGGGWCTAVYKVSHTGSTRLGRSVCLSAGARGALWVASIDAVTSPSGNA